MTKWMFTILALVGLFLMIFSGGDSGGREQIRMVGSSTVYPFATVVAEEFGHKGFKTPIIEATGTGGGFKLFCSGIGEQYPDFSNASRAIKASEVELCAKHGIKDIIEIKIGYDGIVLANSNQAKRYQLKKEHIFKALAKQVPVGGGLKDNPYTMWNEIDSALPKAKIAIYGPPPTSGTRDAFVELVMEPACEDLPEFKAKYPDKKIRQKQCHVIREDGVYVEAGENDNLIVQKLGANHEALGLFGFSSLEENGEVVQGSIIDGSEPTFVNIASGDYSVSRPLFLYAKGEHSQRIPGMKEFIKELVSLDAIGEEGYLIEKGLIPLTGEELQVVQSIGQF